MSEGPEPSESRTAPFPGDAFWRGVESFLTTVGLGSPRTIFKLRLARARWEARREGQANLERGASYSHKACPACARLVPRAAARCDYCGANVRWAPGPGLARTLGLAIPHGSVAMTLVTLNIAFFGVSTLVSAWNADVDIVSALFRPDFMSLYWMGALYAHAVVAGEVWRLWTYQFLHFGALHIFFNVYALLSLGPATEDIYGPWKTAVLYWVTGVGAGLLSIATRLTFFYASGGTVRIGPTVGASGAIFGLIGVLIGHAIRRGGSYGANLRSFLVRWAVYGLVMGFFIGADNAAHIGGLASGFLLGLVVPDRSPESGPAAALWRFSALSVLGLTIYGFAAAALASRG